MLKYFAQTVADFFRHLQNTNEPFWHFNDHNSWSKRNNQTYYLSSIRWSISLTCFKTFKIQFHGVPPLHYVLVCKIRTYLLQMTFSSPLTWISFFYIKFAKFWYIMFCSQFDTNLVPIPWTMPFSVPLLMFFLNLSIFFIEWSCWYCFCCCTIHFLVSVIFAWIQQFHVFIFIPRKCYTLNGAKRVCWNVKAIVNTWKSLFLINPASQKL